MNRKITSIIYFSAIIFILQISSCLMLESDSDPEIINVKLTADKLDSASDNKKKLNSAISSAKANSIILLESGTYYIDSQIQITFKNKLTIKGGDNTILINTDYDNLAKSNIIKYMLSRIFSISYSTYITLENIGIDYYQYTTACGVIKSIKDDYTYVELFDGYLNSVNKKSITGEEYAMSIDVLDGKGAAKYDYYASNEGYTTSLENGLYKIKGKFGEVGLRIVIRFTLGTFASPAVVIDHTSDLLIKNFNIYSCPSASFYCLAGNKNFIFDNLRIKTRTSHELWGSNVDGIHMQGIEGYLYLNNSIFYGMGDDALNIHSIAAVTSNISGNKATLKNGYSKSTLDSSWGSINDIIRFYSDNFDTICEAKIVSKSGSVYQFDVDFSQYSNITIAQNLKYNAELIIENTTVDGGRARAFLIQTENVHIKKCNIQNLSLAGIILSPDILRWYELGPSKNVFIENNNFSHVCAQSSGNNYGAILLASHHDYSTKVYTSQIHENINILNNNFEDIKYKIVYASNVNNLYIKDNTIPASINNPYVTNYCKNVTIA